MGTYVDIGADEVNPDCDDTGNDLDWNVDGILNLHEFAEFSKAWDSHDPNDPDATDPNIFVNWNAKCNLVATEDSQYVIDIEDIAVFAVDWLWQACWRDEGLWEVIGEGSSMMESASMGLMATAFVEPTAVTSPQPMDPQEILGLLDTIWEEDLQQGGSIDKKVWKEFINSVEISLFGDL